MAKKPKNKNRGPQKPAASTAAKPSARSNGRAKAGAPGALQESAVETPAIQEPSTSHVHDPVDASPVQAVAGDAPDATARDAMASDAMAGDAMPADAPGAGLDAGAALQSDADAGSVERAAADSADATQAAGSAPGHGFDLAPVEVFDSGVGGGNADDIRGVLIQLSGARLLLPNATIAEVLSYAEPDAVEDTPDWLLGRIRWRGWQLPLIAFAQLAGITNERGGLGSKVVVLKSLAGGKTPYFAVLTQGFPRLVTVSREALMVDEDTSGLPEAILAHVRLNQDDAYVPDLERVEQMIGEAMAEAA